MACPCLELKHSFCGSEKIRKHEETFTMIFFTSRCKIDWNAGKNITQKTVKKKQKHKGRGQTRVITKTVQNDSFFNFFNPPEGI